SPPPGNTSLPFASTTASASDALIESAICTILPSRAAISARNVPTNGTTTVPLITARSNRATAAHSIPVPCTAVRGVLVSACGGLDAMQLTDLPSPVPGPGQVLVEVHA